VHTFKWLIIFCEQLLSGFSGTFMGPCAYDIAQLLADYILFYHEHMLTELDNDTHRQVAYKMVSACDQTGIFLSAASLTRDINY
jgi:hypothetical protein